MTRIIPIVLTIGLAFGVRLFRLDVQSLWWDEGHSIFVASHPIPQIPTLPAMDVHPPGYFALLHGWMALAGESEFALRYLSVIFSLLTVALLWRFAAALDRRAGAVTALLAAVSPLYVAYAQEVRSYAMLTCLGLLSTYALYRLLTRPTRVDIAVYIVASAACLYTHYGAMFLLLFHNAAWLTMIITPRDKIPPLKRWLATQAGVALLFGPQLWLASRQIADYANPNLMPPALPDFILRSWQAYTVGLTVDPTFAGWGMLALAAIIGAGGLTRLHRDWPRLLFLMGWLLIPLAAYFVVLQSRPSFEPRYLITVTPAVFLLLGLVRPRFLQLVAIGILTFALWSYYTDSTYFKDDSAGVAQWLATETTANDIVYVDVPHPFHYYAPQIPAPTRYLFVDVHTIAETLSAQASKSDRLYWVTWRGSDTDPRGIVPFLMDKYGSPLGIRDFRGYRVQWYALHGDDFDVPTQLDPIDATFGDVMRLDGASFGDMTVTPGESAWVVLHWSLLRPTEVNYRVSVRVRHLETGYLAAQVDKDVLNDRHFRTAAWPLNDPALNQAINVYTLPIPADAPSGAYRVEVVLYNAEPPYPSEGVTGTASTDEGVALLGQIKVAP